MVYLWRFITTWIATSGGTHVANNIILMMINRKLTLNLIVLEKSVFGEMSSFHPRMKNNTHPGAAVLLPKDVSYTQPPLSMSYATFQKVEKLNPLRKRVDVWVGGDCKSNLVPAAWARTGHQRGRLAAASAADEHFVVFLFFLSPPLLNGKS